jgi:DNA ligase-4
VSSSLRRVCWELVDPTEGLEEEKSGVTLMECFQPQLAQFQQHSFQKMIDKLGVTEENPTFWIEEKLDGERMQLHMQEDEKTGEPIFGFWSRKGKDYTYLYGNSFEDDNSSLTRHIKPAFAEGVRNIILDGEMITWDPLADVMVGFGTLKTAAISGQQNPYDTSSNRPLFRVFDCLYLNDQNLTPYMLEDRHKALEKSIKNVHRRIEIHQYQEATHAGEIDAALRKVVAESSEGLVLKNPRSIYRLNSRNDDWMKVKPEYMDEFGESLDCVVIGGYYGSGHRGGDLSSFLCGLRASANQIKMGKANFVRSHRYFNINTGADPMKCWSFFKVGGGFRAPDYALIKQMTKDKWIKWDRNSPPTDLIELGGGREKQYERPDVWIKPCDSIVLEAKAASVGMSDQFAFGYTLRFPRFKKLRDDKKWSDALSIDEFIELKKRVDEECKEKDFKVSEKRKVTKRLKKELVIAGNNSKVKTKYAGPQTAVFEGLDFCVLSEMLQPQKKSKADIEQILKSNGGSIFQSVTVKENIICIGEKKVVKVVSLIKSGHTNIIKPSWLLDALKQAEIDGPGRQRFLLPLEPGHMFHMTNEARDGIEGAVDEYGDSYARDITPNELKRLMDDMVPPKNSTFQTVDFLYELEKRGKGLGETSGSIFRRCVVCFVTQNTSGDEKLHLELQITKSQFVFAGGSIAFSDDDQNITHYVLVDDDEGMAKSLLEKSARQQGRLPKIVSLQWLQESWFEKTLLDEDKYIVAG